MENSKRLDNLVALITGGGRGIGRAIATQFAAEGAHLFLCATRMETLEETRNLAVYLSSGESDGMTGQSIVLDGGMIYV